MISSTRAGAALRTGLVLLAIAFCVYGLVRQWEETKHALTAMSWAAAGASVVPGITAMVAWMMGWRVFLAGLGSPLPLRAAAQVSFLGQLGKYVPGKVWALVAQVELGKRHDIPRLRSVSAMALGTVTSIASALALAAATLPLTSPAATSRYWWLFPLAPVLLAALHPRIVTFALNLALRIVRRPPLERPVSMATTLRALAWTLLGWALFGVHTWLLALAAGGSGRGLVLLSTGAFALSFAVGFLVFFAPNGIGAREAALVVTLTPVLPPGAPLIVAIVSRVVLSLADLALAGIGILLGGRIPAGLGRSAAAREPGEPGEDQAGGDAAASNVSR